MTTARRALRRRRRNDDGAAAVEFALVTWFALIPLFALIITFGYFLWVKSTMTQAAREGARVYGICSGATTPGDCESLAKEKAVDSASPIDIATSNVVAGGCSSGDDFDLAEVVVSKHYSLFDLFGGITISGKASFACGG